MAEAKQTVVKRAPLPQWWWDRSLRERQMLAGVLAVAIIMILGFGLVTISASGASEADRYVSDLPADRVALWDSVAECESGSDWSANTGNGFYGGLQFTIEGWNGVDGTGQPDQASRNEQIMRAEMLEELQGFEAWPNCSAELGIG